MRLVAQPAGNAGLRPSRDSPHCAIEANVVAEAIVRHVIEHPEETLGVAAFNAKQAQAIRDRLDELASRHSRTRLALERFQDHTDRLFVKNLENVQGDERDVIFISYTYGPDPATKVVMNRFGPMTGQHGWRRLNVLVTRAKRRVEVFSSMKPSDIKGGAERSRGVNSMKDYLQYAMAGQLVDRGSYTGREPDFPFEIALARVIEGLGLRVVPQVGVAGYFVDLGVLLPDSDSEFLLGVECDGAAYHSSKSARDRDRLREEVITARGWKLHRIWSTDWFSESSCRGGAAASRCRFRVGAAAACMTVLVNYLGYGEFPSNATCPPCPCEPSFGRQHRTQILERFAHIWSNRHESLTEVCSSDRGDRRPPYASVAAVRGSGANKTIAPSTKHRRGFN